eukprot:SAG31_NODE_4668_length_3047_cov_1.961330_6_plen_63_part_00
MLAGEDVVEQRRLAGAEEARDDRDWDARVVRGSRAGAGCGHGRGLGGAKGLFLRVLPELRAG